ncbi:hypothetical protein JCM5353_006971 [Sporobolomyces roseus]
MSNSHNGHSSSPTTQELQKQLANAEQRLGGIKDNVHSVEDFKSAVGFVPAPNRPKQVSSSSFQNACRLVGEISAKIHCQEILDVRDKQQAIEMLVRAESEAKEKVPITLQKYLLEGNKFEQAGWSKCVSMLGGILDVLSDYFVAVASIHVYESEMKTLKAQYPRETLLDSTTSPAAGSAAEIHRLKTELHETVSKVQQLQAEASRSESDFRELLGSGPTTSWTYNHKIHNGLIAECRKRGRIVAELECLEKKNQAKTIQQRLKAIEDRETDTEASVTEHTKEHDECVARYYETRGERSLKVLSRIVFSLAKYYTVDATHEVFAKQLRALRLQQLGISNPFQAAARQTKARAHVTGEEPKMKKRHRLQRFLKKSGGSTSKKDDVEIGRGGYQE